jgi:uncharacterized protein (UPF0303 family)
MSRLVYCLHGPKTDRARIRGPAGGTVGEVDYGALIARLEAEEAELQFESFSNDDALALGMAIVTRAKERGNAIAIEIRRGDQQLFHAALAGTTPDNDQWIIRKCKVVARFGRSSFHVGTRLRRDGQTLGSKFFVSDAEFSAHGGAFPVILRGTGPIGVVAVSGLPQEEDHALVIESMRVFLREKKT